MNDGPNRRQQLFKALGLNRMTTAGVFSIDRFMRMRYISTESGGSHLCDVREKAAYLCYSMLTKL